MVPSKSYRPLLHMLEARIPPMEASSHLMKTIQTPLSLLEGGKHHSKGHLQGLVRRLSLEAATLTLTTIESRKRVIRLPIFQPRDIQRNGSVKKRLSKKIDVKSQWDNFSGITICHSCVPSSIAFCSHGKTGKSRDIEFYRSREYPSISYSTQQLPCMDQSTCYGLWFGMSF